MSIARWISLLSMLCAAPASATTLDEVVINQVLTAQASPYYAVTNVRFTDVTIEPGVIILTTGPYELSADGLFTAVGTAVAPILFQSATNGVAWKGLVITNANAGSRIEFCRIEGADNSGLRVHGTPLVLRSCVLANNSAPGRGGGMRTDSPLTLENCVVTNNVVSGPDGRGGGIASQWNLVTCVRCVIADNRAITSSSSTSRSFGGGIYGEGRIELLDGTQVLRNLAAAYGGDIPSTCQAQGGGVWSPSEVYGTNVLIAGNEARADGANHAPTSYGGGIWCKNEQGTVGTVLLFNSEIRDNTANSSRSGAAFAGGVFCYSISAFSSVFRANATVAVPAYQSRGGAMYASRLTTLVNCLIVQNRNLGNTGTQIGSAVVGGDAGSLIENCTIADNTQSRSSATPGALFEFNGIVRNSIIHGNNAAFSSSSPAVEYSLVQGGYAGTGNLDADPLFADRTDYLLTGDSLAVDAGNPDPAFDDAGPYALGSPRNDMGTYGGPGALPVLGYIAPLLIVSQPASQIVNVGSTVIFSVGAEGGSGPIQYQWRFNGAGIAGETNSTLMLTNVSFAQAGTYSVTVVNLGGSLVSTDATLSVTQLKMYAGLTISGIVGRTYRIEYTTNFNVNGWTTLTTITLPSSPYLFIDVDSAESSSRTYRFVLLP